MNLFFFRQVAITTRAITAGGWAVLAQISWRRRRVKATSVTQPAPRTQPATQRLHQWQLHHSRWSPHCCASSLRQYDNYGFFLGFTYTNTCTFNEPVGHYTVYNMFLGYNQCIYTLKLERGLGQGVDHYADCNIQFITA